MNNFNIFFKLRFSDPSITDNRLYQFSLSNYRRLKRSNTNGQYDQLVMDTQSALFAFRDAMVDEATEFAERQAQTKRLQEASANFVAAARRRSSYIKGLINTNPALYEAFFPKGLQELGRLTRANEQEVILRIRNMAQNYANEIGPDMATEIGQLYQAYESARFAQEDQKANVDLLKAETARRREALEAQLGINALTLGLDFYGESRMANVFFRPELLTKRKPGTAAEIVSGELAPDSVTEILLPDGAPPEPEDELNLRNTGYATLVFGLSELAGEVDENKGVMLLPGEQITLQALRLGPEGNAFFNVRNLSEEIAGSYEVEMV